MPANITATPLLEPFLSLELPPFYVFPVCVAICAVLANSLVTGSTARRQLAPPLSSVIQPTRRRTRTLYRQLSSALTTLQTQLFTSMASWEQVKGKVQRFRGSLPPTFRVRDVCFDAVHQRVYFLGLCPYDEVRTTSLYYVDVSTSADVSGQTITDSGFDTQEIESALLAAQPELCQQMASIDTENRHSSLYNAPWQHALPLHWLRQHWCSALSTEEQLSSERRRLPNANGITFLQMDSVSRQLLFTYGGGVFYVHLTDDAVLDPVGIPATTSSDAPRLDVKLGGQQRDLIAFVRQRDLWITTIHGAETRLTFTGDTPALSSGTAEFVMQEEFHRFTGYYWAPVALDAPMDDASPERILYLEVDESAIEVVQLVQRGRGECEEHRYPKPGQSNAVSALRMVEFSHPAADVPAHPTIKRLWHCNAIEEAYPWCEYIVRFGWQPDGKCVWAQLLDRRQRRTAIVSIPVACFSAVAPTLPTSQSSIELLYEETSEHWINITDTLHFLPTTLPHAAVMLLCSEQSGVRSLYRVDAQQGSWTMTAITLPHLHVVDSAISVDSTQSQVYFLAKEQDPREAHLWSATIHITGGEVPQIHRLCEPGWTIQQFAHDAASGMLAVLKSNVSDGYAWEAFRIQRQPSDERTTLQPQHTMLQVTRPASMPVPEFFQFEVEKGVTLHGCYYKPEGYTAGLRYPTILHVYGGPRSQLVVNEYKYPRHLRLHLAARLGFAVVVIDGRGSSDRGTQFEAHLKGRLGMVELEDQLAGLRWLASERGVIDLERVAISGWSYGGYIALMGMAQYSHAFKIAIAGAPVTSWEHYDSAYTERYLGLPSDNPDGYERGSILSHVDGFPDDANRLLIVHGLMDENVHFAHTERLIEALVHRDKPHHIQVYPNERHGLRSLDVNEHYETLTLWWLLSYL